MSYSMTLGDWFQYSDRNDSPYNPTVGERIIVDRFWRTDDAIDGRCEEWMIHSALVPVNQLKAAGVQVESPHELTFEPGWDFEGQFSFGDYSKCGEVQFYPLTRLLKHPVTEEFRVELSHKFVLYHALQIRNECQYYHPIDNLLVAETNLDSHKIYHPTGNVVIHRDYLRDFLVGVKMGLLISVVADRFANAATKEGLELDEIDDLQLDEFTRVKADIHPPETGRGYFRGRSTLWRNFLIEPYDKPRFERSPWHYFGEHDAEDESPTFIVNSEGKREPLPKNTFLPDYMEKGIGNFGYLYFRPEVLQKYLQVPGYRVFFHMRNWGVASLPGGRSTIDVGINSQGLVNAFAPDIADLNPPEQAYWASFSSLPSGEICGEMFQTRMQQNPPHSPGVIELIQDARSQLDTSFQKKFSVKLFKDIEPSRQNRCRLSVGPISDQFAEVFELAKSVYEWVIETMQIDSLRAGVTVLGGKVDEKLRQIKLLERILMSKGMDEIDARSATAPLVALNDLRIGSAHIGSPELGSTFRLMGASTIPKTPRAGWNLCVDTVSTCLNSIASAL